MHKNTIATVSASYSRSVQFSKVESQARDGDHRGSSRRNTRISLGREGKSSVRHRREQTNHAQHIFHLRNVTTFFPEQNLRVPIGGREEFVSAGGRGGAGLQPAGGFKRATTGALGTGRSGAPPAARVDTAAAV